MVMVRLALQSLRNRAGIAVLTILSIALSVMLLVGVEKVRTGARQSFTDTISGADLIVGARGGATQLLLYSVFHMGDATNNLSWKSYQDIANRLDVAWSIPLSLGDSYRGYRVLGTSREFFNRYRYRYGHHLKFSAGEPFQKVFDVVLGSNVASKLGHELGSEIVIAHGTGNVSFVEHADKPFRVSGILDATGTPVDNTVHVSLEAIEAIHIDWQGGMPTRGHTVSADEVRKLELEPKAITAAIVGLKSKFEIFKVQRFINDYPEEPLTAIIPGAELHKLWGMVGTAETALAAVSAMVVATAFIGMVTTLLGSLNQRRREMAILRSVGASPTSILGLLSFEASLLTFIGTVLGVILLYSTLFVTRPYIDKAYGLQLLMTLPTAREFTLLGLIIFAGLLAGLLPAVRAYRLSVADGMVVRD